jgi:hypothetical protein
MRISLPEAQGGHGGGDPKILEDICLGEDTHDPYKILANSIDAQKSIAVGDAVWHSIKQDRNIKLDL